MVFQSSHKRDVSPSVREASLQREISGLKSSSAEKDVQLNRLRSELHNAQDSTSQIEREVGI